MAIFDFFPVPGDRSYWGTFDRFFPDTCFTGLDSETADFTRWKTGLNIPYWVADCHSDGLKSVGTGKGPVLIF